MLKYSYLIYIFRDDMDNVATNITECEFLQLLREQSLEARYILKILYNLDKLTDMKQQLTYIKHSDELYKAFLSHIFKELSKFNKMYVKVNDDADIVTTSETSEIAEENSSFKKEFSETYIENEWCKDILNDCNPLLFIAFKDSINNIQNTSHKAAKNEENIEVIGHTCLEIYTA